MKKALYIIAILLPFTTFSQTFNLNVKISNIKNIKGNIQIGVFNSKGQFLKDGKQYKKLYVKVDDHNMNYTISGLPKDTYALAIFHDENTDSIINKNFIGIPTESFGFSKNYNPKIRAPKFDEVCFTVDKNKEVDISLINKKG